jgi:AraC-like DNA-binding protein
MARFFDKDRDAAVERLDDVSRLLGEVIDRMMNIQGRLNVLEKTIQERMPDKVLTERKFLSEAQAGDEIIDRIVSTIKSSQEFTDRDVDVESIKTMLGSNEGTIVERKRMERIIDMLKRHSKLTSSQLSQLMGLSRTRCNEYFKEMENMNIVEPVILGKEKFYALKGVSGLVGTKID